MGQDSPAQTPISRYTLHRQTPTLSFFCSPSKAPLSLIPVIGLRGREFKCVSPCVFLSQNRSSKPSAGTLEINSFSLLHTHSFNHWLLLLLIK